VQRKGKCASIDSAEMKYLHLSGMFVNYTALYLEGFFFAFRMASAARLSLSYWDMLLG
jgi:hypothetical protein